MDHVPETCPVSLFAGKSEYCKHLIEAYFPSISFSQDPGRHPGIVKGSVVLTMESLLREEVEVNRFQGVIRSGGGGRRLLRSSVQRCG